MLLPRIDFHLIKVSYVAETPKPGFKSALYRLWFNVLIHGRSTLEFNHMLIDALFNIVWRNFRKCSVEMVNQCSCFECTVSFIMSVANEMKDLENLDKRISNHGVLNPRISDKYINSSIFSYTAILICLWPLCSLFQEKLSFLFCQLQKIFHSVGCRGWLGSNHFNEFVKTSIFVKDIHWWCVLGKLGHYFW